MSHYMLLTERFRLLLETTSDGIDAQLLLLDLEARTIELLTSFEEINLHVDADHLTLLVATHATMSPDMNTITCFYGDYETFKLRRITSL
jgi:hypothetical protein